MASERHQAAFIVGAILGGVTAATVTLLKAPQAGAQTRAQLAAHARTWTHGLNEALGRLNDEAQWLVGQAVTRLSSLTERDSGALFAANAAAANDVETAAPALRTGPLPPVGIEETAGMESSGTGSKIDILLDGPRPAGSAQDGSVGS